MSNCFCISIPGTPKKVGKSADIVWVRSTTPVKLRGVWAAAGVAGAADAAANPAASAPVRRKKPRRVSAWRTVSSHPGTHMEASFPRLPRRARSRKRFPVFAKKTMLERQVAGADDGAKQSHVALAG